MEKVKIYRESGQIYIASAATAVDGLSTSLAVAAPAVQIFPANGELTASLVNTNEIKVVDSQGHIVFTNVPYLSLVKKNGSTNIAATAAGVRDTLNGSSYFTATTLESQLTTEKNRIADLENATKTGTNDRGIFLQNAKTLDASYVRLQAAEAKLQTGTSGNTFIRTTESSPGVHRFSVQAGPTNSEIAIEALRVVGSSTAQKATVETGTGVGMAVSGGLTVSSGTTLKALSFSSTGSPHSVSFSNASVSGLAASSIGSGTFANARISSASVLQHADNYSSWNLKTGGVQRTTVSSGGDLNLVGGTDISLAYSAGGTVTINSTASGSGIADVVDDTSPQLGGHLDVNGQEIRSLSNNNITLRPNGTGTVVTTAELTLDYNNPQIKFKGDDNIHYRISVDETNNEIVFGHTTYEGIRMDSYGALTFPNINGSPSGGVTAGYLKVDGSGNVSTDTPTDTNTNIGNTDFTLSAARKIIVGGYDFSINDTTYSPLFLWDDSADIFEFRKPVLFTNNHGYTTGEVRLMEAPAASGAEYVGFKAPGNITANCLWTLPAADGTNGQVLTTNGSKTLSWTTASGGGASETWLGDMGGIYTWASTDSGETVCMSTSYGRFFYSHSSELSQTGLRVYSSSATINTTTATIDNWKLSITGIPVHTTNKKVRCDYFFRVQSAPLDSTWGISIWGGSLGTSGAADSERTMTLRGRVADITANPNTSTVVHHGSFTTSSTINGGMILPLLENRSGTLTTTTRIYGQFRFFLVD